MISDPEQAEDEIYTMLREAWEAGYETLNIPIVWGNVAHDIQGAPDAHGSPEYFLEAKVLHETGRTTSLRGPNGSRQEQQGTVFCKLYGPEGESTGTLMRLINIAGNAYMGTKSPNGVWFRNPQYTTIGSDRTWFVVAMTTTFIYDLIR